MQRSAVAIDVGYENTTTDPIETKIINPLKEPELVKAIWLELERSAKPSFFNSWAWIGTWVSTLPHDLDIKLVVHSLKGQYLSCYFLGTKKFSAYGVLTKRKAYLNATGYQEFDTLVIEYNDVLKGNVDIPIDELLLKNKGLDDYVIPSSTAKLVESDNVFTQNLRIPSHWVDLDKVRNSDNSYLSLLSTNKRKQIKRSLREYSIGGEVSVAVASNLPEAFEYLSALSKLHQIEWVKRGEKGAFSNDYFCYFHRMLIHNNFEKGNIQLIRVFNESEDIGYLYNFVHDNKVSFYQSGFNYKESNKFRPGLISHFLAIKLNAETGMSSYNFLGGKSQYKKSLSTNTDFLNHMVITPKTFKSKAERFVRGIIGR